MLRDGPRLVQFGAALGLLLCLTSVSGTSQTPQPKPAAPGTGAISGVVSDGATKRPLSGVRISLIGGGAPRRWTISDSKGRFVFAGLAAADRYYLEAEKPGYVAEGLGRRRTLFPGTAFPLSEGEWIADANFVMLPLGTISGTVLDERGEPVVNIPVRVLARIPLAGMRRLASGPVTRTDDRGIYRLPGLVGGSYFVAVQSVQSVVPPSTSAAATAGLSQLMITLSRRPIPKMAGLDISGAWLIVGEYATPPPIDGHRRVYPPLFFPNARSILNATAVNLATGEEKRGIDFTLEPMSGLQVSGRVEAPADVLAGLVVRLLPEGTEALTAGFEQATALVRPDGTFTMVGIPPGRYTIEARTTISSLSFNGHVQMPSVLTTTPGMVPAGETTGVFSTIDSAYGLTTFGTRYGAGHESYSGRQLVTVGSSDISNMVVRMARGVRISGRVVREDGAALQPTTHVGAEPAGGDPALAGSPADRNVARHPAGAFAIEGLQPGEYFLRATGGFVKSIAAGLDYTNRPFDTTSGADISDVVITLIDKPAALSGMVRDRQGGVVREGAVILFPAERELWTRFGVNPPRIKMATFFGRHGYQMTALPAGEYFAIAVERLQGDEWHDPRFFPAAASLATRVTLAWGMPAVQDLTIRQVVIK